MKILLTGANGYIGRRLLPVLIEQGHFVYCSVRDKKRFKVPESFQSKVEVIEVDFLQKETLHNIPNDIDGAYYLIHSMSHSSDFVEMESESAQNFISALKGKSVKHVLYLTGIVNQADLSKHLSSRKKVEEILATGDFHFTALRAGIIIGSGSASFEIIRDLVEKLPLLITPKWVKTLCQPIGIRDVISYLSKSLFEEYTYDKSFDIYGPDILSYKEMMLEYASVRNLKRYIYVVPLMTPRLSSYWLYFVTSTTYKLAVALVNSMKIDVVAEENDLGTYMNIEPMSYRASLESAFSKIEQNSVISSWKDSFISTNYSLDMDEFISVPEHGCFKDRRELQYKDRDKTIDKIWKIGGTTGWYKGNFLWKLRGLMDKMVGGVGLRRGRTHYSTIEAGDAIDFWRVLFANKKTGRLLLYAEMKLPGDAWLEFKIENDQVIQEATFRPWGIWGRLYWWLVYPFHGIIFNGMLKEIAK